MNRTDLARELAILLGHNPWHYPRPTYDELDDPSWVQPVVAMSDEEILALPIMEYFEAIDGNLSATIPTIGRILEMIEEIEYEGK